MSKKQALIVEDTAANRMFFERLMMQASFDVVGVGTGHDALEQAKTMEQLSLIVLDMEIPDINGLELTVRLRKQFPDACIIIATMHDEHSLMQSAFEKGCDVFLVKPHGFMELFKRLTTDGSPGLHSKRPLIIDQFGPRSFNVAVS